MPGNGLRVFVGLVVAAVASVGCASQYEQAVAFHNAGRYPEAISGYEVALQQQPWNEAAHRNLGLALIAVQQYPAASQELAAALRLAPRDWVARYNLGISYHRLHQYYPAMRQLVYALQLNPRLYAVHYELGELCTQLLQYQCAIAELTAYLQRAPRVFEQRNTILRASYEVRRLTTELAFIEAQRRAQAEAEQEAEQARIAAATRLQELENERARARREAAAYQPQNSVQRPSGDLPVETPLREPSLTDQQQVVLAIVATVGCEALRRNGEETAGQGDLGDQVWSFAKQIGGMACRDQAIEAGIEKLFPRLGPHQRILLKQIIGHVLEGDFKPSSLARDVGRDETIAYIKVHAPDLDAPAQFANFIFDVYLQRRGS